MSEKAFPRDIDEIMDDLRKIDEREGQERERKIEINRKILQLASACSIDIQELTAQQLLEDNRRRTLTLLTIQDVLREHSQALNESLQGSSREQAEAVKKVAPILTRAQELGFIDRPAGEGSMADTALDALIVLQKAVEALYAGPTR